MIKNEITLQHYAHRVHKALEALGEATADQVSYYMTAHGHRITTRRARRYLETLPGINSFHAFRLQQGRTIPRLYELAA